MVLKDIPASARPREKLLAHGAAALADSELIALLLRTGFKGTSVLQLADNLLTAFNGLDGLLRATANDLKRIKGLGPAKRTEIVAVMELARRSLKRELTQRPVFDSLPRVKDFLQMQLGGRDREVFAVMFLDAQQKLLLMEEMFTGSLMQTAVHPREIVKRAIEVSACAVVLAHNHPSGDAEPSRADESLTQTLVAALKLIDVTVLDHMVVGQTQVISFFERGLL
jgi:DNA repair protein RadC